MKEFAEPIISRPSDDSLVLHLVGRGSRREGTVLADLSKKGHTGTINDASWKNTPLGHSVLDFDGDNDYVNCGHGGSLNLTSSFSVSIWFKADESRIAYILAKRSDVANGYDIFLVTEGYIRIVDGAGNIAYTGFNYTPGIWTHLVIVVNTTGTGFTAYKNGVAGSEVAIIVFPDNANQDLYIGSRSGPTILFNGKIDDVRIYKKALTSNEAMEMYQNTKHYYGK